MEKVLIHDEAPTEVHLMAHAFADKTICGERLHPAFCVIVENDKIPVTCEYCKLVEE